MSNASKEAVVVDGSSLTLEDVVRVARFFYRATIPNEVLERVQRTRQLLETQIVEKGMRCYGVTTGVGPLSRVSVSVEDAEQLQKNLVRSHACATGAPLPTEVVRAAILLRANALASAHSGVRPLLLKQLIALLNHRIHPIVPSKGSVGASGDLALLAHIALAVIGDPEGRAEVEGRVLSADQALRSAGLHLLTLSYKEGLALINGLSVSTAILSLATYDAEQLVRVADLALAMSLEAVGGFLEAFDDAYLAVHSTYPLSNGHRRCADNVRRLVEGSQLLHSPQIRRAHDPYSIRCAPQIHGSVREGVAFTRQIVEHELNAVDDSPLIFEDPPHCRSGGNFHGQSLALAADVLTTALTVLGNVSERRITVLLSPNLNEVLPPFLVHPESSAGLRSGLMLAQYVAAQLAAENRSLSHPACVESIPTSANFEDLVSMSLTAAQKARQVLENVQRVLAIELLCAYQALTIRGIERAGRGTKAACQFLQAEGFSRIEEDRSLHPLIERLTALVRSGKLLQAVEAVVGPLA